MNITVRSLVLLAASASLLGGCDWLDLLGHLPGSEPGGGGEPPPPQSCLSGEYIDQGDIHGYAWYVLAVDGVEESDMLSTMRLDYSLPGTAWEDYAIVGMNLNQTEDGEIRDFDTSRFGGICVDGSGFSRVQIGDETGRFWCADTTGGCLEWSEFTEDCWMGGSVSFEQGMPISKVMVVQPSLGEDGSMPVSDTICVGMVAPFDEAVATCGNGLVEDFEECDDGNSVLGDGCDSSCLLESQ